MAEDDARPRESPRARAAATNGCVERRRSSSRAGSATTGRLDDREHRRRQHQVLHMVDEIAAAAASMRPDDGSQPRPTAKTICSSSPNQNAGSEMPAMRRSRRDAVEPAAAPERPTRRRSAVRQRDATASDTPTSSSVAGSRSSDARRHRASVAEAVAPVAAHERGQPVTSTAARAADRGRARGAAARCPRAGRSGSRDRSRAGRRARRESGANTSAEMTNSSGSG